MEDLNPGTEDLRVSELGEARFPSPLELGTRPGGDVANYVDNSKTVLLSLDRDATIGRIKDGKSLSAFQKAGPRQRIFFDPAETTAAVVSCGGLCPGINNVIRSLVMELSYRYGIARTLGVRYGFRGFIPKYGYAPVELTPEKVKDIHEKGGSILCTSRGEQSSEEIVDSLQKMKANILFAIGGDGTMRGAEQIARIVKEKNLPISIVGIPKTVDNDICFVEKTFGLETAFAVAGEAIRSAHTEAIGSPNGIGIVKVMGRMSGFIAANAALAMNEVNFVLIPEVPFHLEGEYGLYALLGKRLRKRSHAVIIVAEGAGQEYVADVGGKKDESGNLVLGDIGIYLKTEIKKYFKEKTDLYVNIKYIDPGYMVRSVPANANDAIFCMQLAQNAVHAGMAGKTNVMIGLWHGQFTHVPIPLATSRRKQVSPEDPLWLSVIEATGQPTHIGNAPTSARS
jgi:6-phosphofructokinase 1